MQLETTYRGLSSTEMTQATQALEKGMARLGRLAEEPCVLRAVIESGPEFRIILTFIRGKTELTTAGVNHEIYPALSEAFERLKVRLSRHHQRKAKRKRRHGAAPQLLLTSPHVP